MPDPPVALTRADWRVLHRMQRLRARADRHDARMASLSHGIDPDSTAALYTWLAFREHEVDFLRLLDSYDRDKRRKTQRG